MEILEIKQEKASRYLVYTDEAAPFSLYEKELRQWGIAQGAVLSAGEWERLCREVLHKRAIRRAMYLLQQMDRTEAQLRQKLTQGHYPPASVEAALDYVKSYHYVDDLRYATSYIHLHQESKSRLQLVQTLKQRGVSAEIIEAALAEAYEADEAVQIQRLLTKKHYDPVAMDQKQKFKIYQYLQRKGFSNFNIKQQMDLT